MIGLIQFIIFGHIHKYKLFSVIDVYANGFGRPVKHKIISRCEVCGKIKTVEV